MTVFHVFTKKTEQCLPSPLRRKSCAGNQIIIVMSSFSKNCVFKVFSVHIKAFYAFTLKKLQMFSVHLTLEILDREIKLLLRGHPFSKSHVFKVVSDHTKTQSQRFPIPPVGKRLETIIFLAD